MQGVMNHKEEGHFVTKGFSDEIRSISGAKFNFPMHIPHNGLDGSKLAILQAIQTCNDAVFDTPGVNVHEVIVVADA
ncbi:hypothetical protein EAO73_04635 [Streptomyces sp. col6]|nr:hypothetical protein EAO73_04635 [Streptomyces sp. col6]